MTRPSRMSDVAKLAGVGTMTVSRVLNGNVHVTEETRARVLEAIAELNYMPNEVARSLRDQRTRQIGIIVPNLHDPFFAMCAQSISIVAKERAYSTVITTSDEDPATEFVEAKRMLRRHIEGLIIIPAQGKSKLRDPEFERTPIVTLDRPVIGSSYDCILTENKRGAQLGVQHLIDHNHRRIAYLGLSAQLWTMKERINGYIAAMEAAKLLPDIHSVTDSPAEMLQTIRQLLAIKTPPTAFFCSNNLTTRNALHALSSLNIKIPDQIAIVGFDDFEMADIIKPAVTVVRQPTDVLGRIAAELLFSRLAEANGIEKAKRIVLPVELVVRDSCGSHGNRLLKKTAV
ncbi:MAG: LacI family transcriptional regulator [Acidobacteria bacterium]|nr:LacI family transcriptional regulator [Acidobacteriota bacterium]